MLFSYGPFGRVGCVDSLLCGLNNFALQNYYKKMTYARVGQKILLLIPRPSRDHYGRLCPVSIRFASLSSISPSIVPWRSALTWHFERKEPRGALLRPRLHPAFDRSHSRSLVRTLPPLYRGANSTKRTGTSSKSFCWRCNRYSLRPLSSTHCSVSSGLTRYTP